MHHAPDTPRFSGCVAALARSSPWRRAVAAVRRRRARAADTLPARLTDRGILAAERGLVRAERVLPVRQPAVERDLLPVTSFRIC